MSEELTTREPGTCRYCGCPLDARVYFCPRCAKPHRAVESLLPASVPEYEDLETKLRTGAKPAWTIFFVYLVVIGVGSVVALSIWGTENTGPVVLFVQFALLVTTVGYAVRYWTELRPFLARSGISRAATWTGLVILAPLLALNFGYHHLVMEIFALEMDDYGEYFSSLWGPVIFTCLMPAVVEEIGFRGIIQHQFEKVVSPWIAIAVASAVFSVAHFSVFSAPYLALVGVLLGWMKWKTGSLYPSMVAHFAHNYIVVTHF